MGLFYRKSINLGPLRINLSKSGIGFSFGTKGLRSGVASDGRKYSSASLPGTGLRYFGNSGSGLGLLGWLFGGIFSGHGRDQERPESDAPQGDDDRLNADEVIGNDEAQSSMIEGLEELEREQERKEERRGRP